MYAQVSFMRIYYFMFMLLGAITAIDLTREDNNMIFSCLYRISSGVKSDEEVKRPYVSIKRSFALFFVSIVLYYVCMAIYKLGPFFCKFQIVSLIPLLLAIYFFFMFCSCEKMIKVFDKTVLGNVVYAISALTLDLFGTIRIVYRQYEWSVSVKYNHHLPYNILYGVRFEMSVASVFTNIWWRRF